MLILFDKKIISGEFELYHTVSFGSGFIVALSWITFPGTDGLYSLLILLVVKKMCRSIFLIKLQLNLIIFHFSKPVSMCWG